MPYYAFPTNPAALGIVTQPDHTAPPVSLLSAIAAAAGSDVRFNSLEVEGIKSADKTPNAGVVYIGQLDMVVSTGVGVIKSLGAGEQWSFGRDIAGNTLDPAALYLQTDNDNDGAQVRGLTA